MTIIEKLLLELLKIPSVSGQEKEIGNFIVSQLDDFRVKKQFVSKERFNIIAKKGRSDLWIVAHMDTVPGVVPIKITKDKIYGRGAVDNKGNIAGAIMAGKKLEDINLLFTVGEEEDFCGAKKANIKKGKFIVMEPTNLEIMRGQWGAIAFRIETRGKQTHSASSFSKKDSAVFNLVDTLQEMYAKNWTSFNAVITEGGEKDSIVPPYAEAKIFTRPRSVEEYKKIISYLDSIEGNDVSIKIDGCFEPCSSNLIKKGKIVPFFSEMAFFRNSVLFGAGDIRMAHTADEYVLRKELNKLEDGLVGLIKKIK